MDQAEEQRLRATRQLNLLDTPAEERFDRVVRLAQRLFGVPMAAVTLLDEDRQWMKAQVGLGAAQIPREGAFCDETIRHPGPFVVADARSDARFRDHPGVAGSPGIRFYAGQPLSAPDGHRVGTLCIFDAEPREATPAELAVLRDLADWVEKELTLDSEWSRAAEVQQRLLPRSAPDLPGYTMAGRCLLARDVGGDFFDWYLLGEQFQLGVADVMGKGLPAAIIAASVRAVLKGASRFNAVEEAVTRAAYSLDQDLAETSTFVTMFVARLDPPTGRLRYVDAGHGLGVVLEPSGGFRRLMTGGLPVGAAVGDRWQAGTTVLAPGETLLVASDGYLDFFGSVDDALEAAVRVNRESATVEQMADRVTAFCRRQSVADDVTMVLLRRGTGTAAR